MSASHLAPSPQGRQQISEGPGAAGCLAGLRALIVEDEMFVAWHMEDILERMQVEVCGIAASAEAGVERAGHLQPDVVLMDINLGRGADGIEAARQISGLTKARFLFVTAYGDAELGDRIEAVAPASPVLQKPATSAMIEAALLELFA